MIKFFIKWSDQNQLLRHTEPHHRKISWTYHRKIIVISWTNTDFRPNGRGRSDGWSIICRILGWTHSSAVNFFVKSLISITKWSASLLNHKVLYSRIKFFTKWLNSLINHSMVTKWHNSLLNDSLLYKMIGSRSVAEAHGAASWKHIMEIS